MMNENGMTVHEMIARARRDQFLDQEVTRGKKLGEAILHAARSATAMHICVLGGNPGRDRQPQAGNAS